MNVPGSVDNQPLPFDPGALVDWTANAHGVTCRFESALMAVAILASSLIRIRFTPQDAFAPRRSWSVTPPDDAYPPTEPEVAGRAECIEIRTPASIVEISRAAGRVTLRAAGGRTIVDDGERGGPTWDDRGRSRWSKRMPAGERYFGFGERTGLLDKRGRRYTCWTTDEWEHQGPSTDQLYVAIPFFLALDEEGRSYGIFLNNTHRTAFDLTSLHEERLVIESAAGELDYYVMCGPTPAQVVQQFTRLTGRMSLPPKWALGYQQSRWTYCPASDVEAIAAEFRRRDIPCDALHLDIGHMDGYRVFTWDPRAFPNPVQLAAGLRSRGMKLVTIVDAGVKHQPDGGYGVYAEGHRANCFVKANRGDGADEFLGWVWPGLCAFPDHTRAEVREWWGSWYIKHADLGIAGFLNDMNEPAMHDRPYDAEGSASAEPPAALPFGVPDEHATHAEVRNVYALLENQASYQALATRQERPFLITRAGFAGVQRYAAVWTGDVWSSWEHLEMSLPQLLNLGLSGVPFAGADIGGFFGHADAELLARWTQLGTFYPLMRNNSAANTARQEPWAWGPDTEAVCRNAIELRYRLLPYLYTLFEEAARSGNPILRPLFYHYPDDPQTHTIHDEALVGRDLLIAPIMRPGQTRRDVYLPAGRWFEVRSGQSTDGPGHVVADAALADAVPLYARAGSIVPWGPVMQWVDERPLDPLVLHAYVGEDGRSAGRLYEDDGRSFEYAAGTYAETVFSCERNRSGYRVTASNPSRNFATGSRQIEVVVHDVDGIVRGALAATDVPWHLDLGR